ncbi:SDR family NAD(P)-dependent oxidoreductase [Legionella israelensis]|uniref:Oxidoreductase dehydrogenase, short chain n=2 Tax=Legionella israelensis TaxID=454 RepID=A0A0W0VUH2_9GAMM|nr:SDR family NAD(P)-dependent oxidoreductase [Legionella israelensis]SCX79593.1 NAD(P)-dependent dehydrogenase, short-chain alcohol dehydrogenase family [Legionella israelensis DSM 19235]KTD23678.1 oxidoreductase dehydrogenase, short chain [Legionella israelensis]QBR84053.1 SDR family NAD(P)-dependent oxidoreductase [Legionella israelensis]QBS10939.1 SDR family NAD(P)-dependent oxidoreductase [Legionella israelensis]STX57930.1 oxidoreductase dehydrogenase, short chain [Legionella israelensis]
MEMDHQVVVITGAASGLGLAMARICLQKDMHVVMADNAITSLCDQVERLSRQYNTKVMGVVCDVTQAGSFKHLAKQTYERFKRIDWLINNAGISGHLAPIWELTNEHIRKVVDINLFGAINGIQAFLPLMFKQPHRGHIINMASIYGLCSGSNMSAYAISKHGVVALSEALYFDLKRLNKPVDVSVICPSFVNTPLLTNSAPLHEDKLHQLISSLIKHSRPAEEVAAYIIDEITRKTFYILPDKEIKHYCEQKTNAIITQSEPHIHNLEKLITSLSNRALTMD